MWMWGGSLDKVSVCFAFLEYSYSLYQHEKFHDSLDIKCGHFIVVAGEGYCINLLIIRCIILLLSMWVICDDDTFVVCA